MKQRGVGEYAIETLIRQIDLEEILLPHFATAVMRAIAAKREAPSKPTAR
jgi:hypothetical protein